jgi:hypothetical protein
MSDISNQNALRMIAESKRMHAAVEDLKRIVILQNQKITTLTDEMAGLKKAHILASVAAQMEARGHGGTA